MPVYLSAYYDAGWGSELEERNYCSGASVVIEDNFIFWWAKRKPVVYRSSIEAWHLLFLRYCGYNPFLLN
jgi:hypothetical protein